MLEFSRTTTSTRTRTTSQLRNIVVNPDRHPVVELVLQEAQRNERVDIQEVSHGKSAKMSSTCLLVGRGASGPVSLVFKRFGGALGGPFKMRLGSV